MSKPYFSIIIPTYNCENYIEKTLDNVLGQTFQDYEVLLVDDSSKDGTLYFLSQYNDRRIRVFENKENQGPSVTRNRAISLAQGKWIAILDSDDIWAENRLEVFHKHIEDSNNDIYLDNILFFNDGEHESFLDYYTFKNLRVHREKVITIEDVLKWDLGILQPVIKREFLEQENIFYRSSIKYGEDLFFLCECIANGAKVSLIPFNGYFYRNRPNSLVKNKVELFDQLVEVQFLIKNLRSWTNREKIYQQINRRVNEIRLLYKVNIIKYPELKNKTVQSDILLKTIPPIMMADLIFKKAIEKLRLLLLKRKMRMTIPAIKPKSG